MQAGTYGCYAGLQVRECVLAHFVSPLMASRVEDSGGLLGGGGVIGFTFRAPPPKPESSLRPGFVSQTALSRIL